MSRNEVEIYTQELITDYILRFASAIIVTV